MNIIQAHIPYGGKDEQVPEEIIIHAMGEFILDDYGVPVHAVSFLNEYELSAHLLVAPSGDIFRCRADTEIAWHARGHNVNTIGIEFLVEGEHSYGSFIERIKTPYLTGLQFDAGVEITKQLLHEHPIKKIRRHSDVSPGRKVDPGLGFPWDYYLRQFNYG